MQDVIRLGDGTSHGGKVVGVAATNFKIQGAPVACVGDTCSCPIPGHSDCTITTGSAHHLINGKQVAFDGDGLSCGAKLISSFTHFSTTEYGYCAPRGSQFLLHSSCKLIDKLASAHLLYA